jgi:hypothetical protein
MKCGLRICVVSFAVLTFAGASWLSLGREASALGVTLKPQPSVHQLRSLSVHDLNTLPDSTLIRLPGRSVTLGALRKSHAALTAFRSSASAIGLRARKRVPVSPRQSVRIPSAPLSLQLPVTGKPLPTSYIGYCKAVQATLCLVYPPDSLFFGNEQPGSPGYNANSAAEAAADGADSRGVVTVDPWISSAVCSLTGGYMTTYDGCAWKFPIYAQATFSVAAGHYVLTKDSGCATFWAPFPPLFTVLAIPNGAHSLFSINGALVSTYNNYNGSQQLDCWLQVNQD